VATAVESFLAALTSEGRPQVCLIHGDLVLAEPGAERIAAGYAKALGCPADRVETHRRPASLAPLLQDLRTFSLFGGAKILLAVDTAVFADRAAAAELIDDAAEVLPLSGGAEKALSARERQAASRLFQAFHLFDIDPADRRSGSPEQALGELPAWVLEGGSARRGRGSRARGKKQVEELRGGLVELLEAARREGITGAGQGDLAALADAIRGGLPGGHVLVLAERPAPADHPVVRLLAERKAVLAVGRVEAAERGGGWQGLDLLAEEMERQTGVGIAADAMAELSRRTLRQEGDGRKKGIDADSTARLAGEYRKLANLVSGQASGASSGRIDRKLVEQTVEDRGEEDVWQLLDAVAAGRGGEALDRLHRLLRSADDVLAARLSFFSLFASFCRQLTAIRGLMRATRVPAGEANYGRFKDRHAPALQGDVPGGGKNPIAGLHPFRLHRAYLAASRLPEAFLARLPSELLDTELQLKGEASEADTALADLVARVATAGGRQAPDRARL
jgi:DNA polymerase III delta subunit